MKHLLHLSGLALLAIALAPARTARAADAAVLSPVAVVGTDLGTGSSLTPPENLINQSGIETPFVSGSTPFETYFARPESVFAMSGDQGTNNWQGSFSFSLPVQGYLDFDLGAVYRLNKLAIWNRSLKEVNISVRDDLEAPERAAGSFTLINRLNFPFSYAVDVVTFPSAVEGRYLRISVRSVHLFNPGDTFAIPIAGEVAVSAVPLGPPIPTLQIRLAESGDVVVEFGGVLQSATTLGGPFADVPGNPGSPLILPRSTGSPGVFYRARSE